MTSSSAMPAPDRPAALVLEGLDAIPDRTLEHWRRRIPRFRLERADRYRFRADRVRSLAAFCLLAALLGRIPDSFRTGDHDKPELPGQTPHFNMTHAHDCVAAAVGPRPLGIDAEEMCPAPLDVMPRVFTPHEIRQIENAPDRNRAFFTFWTLKESYIKALGLGLSFPLMEVEFTILPDGVHCSDPAFVFSTVAYPGYHLSLCAETAVAPTHISLDALCSKWDSLPDTVESVERPGVI